MNNTNEVDSVEMNIDNEGSFIDDEDSVNGDIDENTSSQQGLIDYLKDVDSDIEYIHIDKKLYGVLDLSVISINHKNVKHIYFGEGDITELKNFPESMTKLECGRNLLSSLKDLPTGIVEIDVSHNMITMIEMRKLPKLQKLNCSWNRLGSLNELPDSIIEIIVDNNSIREIDLSGLVNLERLDCVNNSGIVVKNVPTEVTVNMDNNGEKKKEDDVYDSALYRYFLLKQKYENQIAVEKRQRYSVYMKNKKLDSIPKPISKPKCVICGKGGGTIFTKTKEGFRAVCNNTIVCFEIDIKTNSKSIKDVEEIMNDSKKKVEKSKIEIIKQKMDTLFGYIDEKESTEVFLEKAKKYTEENSLYEEHLKEFNDIFHNTERDDAIQKEEIRINKYEENIAIQVIALSSTTENEIHQRLIKELVEMQNELGKMNSELTKLKYEHNYNYVSIDIGEKDSYEKSIYKQFVIKNEIKFKRMIEPVILMTGKVRNQVI